MQLIAEHQFLVHIQDIFTTWNVDPTLLLMDLFIVVHITQYMRHPCLCRLTVHAFRDVEQDGKASTTDRDIKHVDAQLTFVAFYPQFIDFTTIRIAVHVDNGLPRVHRLALLALIALQEVRMWRIERGANLQLSLFRLIVLLRQFPSQVLFQGIFQLSADTPRIGIIGLLPETLGRGWHGRGLFHILS